MQAAVSATGKAELGPDNLQDISTFKAAFPSGPVINLLGGVSNCCSGNRGRPAGRRNKGAVPARGAPPSSTSLGEANGERKDIVSIFMHKNFL